MICDMRVTKRNNLVITINRHILSTEYSPMSMVELADVKLISESFGAAIIWLSFRPINIPCLVNISPASELSTAIPPLP